MFCPLSALFPDSLLLYVSPRISVLCTFCLRKKEALDAPAWPSLSLLLSQSLSTEQFLPATVCYDDRSFCKCFSDLKRNGAHAHMRKLGWLWRIYRQPPHFTDYIGLSLSLCLTHSHTQTKTGLQRGQSLISQSFSLRRSQTSLRCSKNKIPAVKLSALRFCAFNAEANQKFEKKKKRETWGTPTLARSTLSRPCLKCRAALSLCEGARAQKKKSTENANLKSSVF